MTPPALPLEQLANCSEDAFVAHLGSVFEHAPWVARAVAKTRPFASAAALHAAMMAGLRALPEAQLVELLRGHPELAGAQARSGAMTADSIAEQGGLSLGALEAVGDDTAARWDRLNARYRERFGFPFILCIRRHTRGSALREFERRLANERPAELRNALDEIGRISRLRLAARVDGHGLTDIAGRLSVHVLDLTRGAPARALRLELHELAGERRTLLREASVEAPDTVLLEAQPLRIGRYELRLHAGEYFAARGAAPFSDEPFLGVVPFAFGLDAPEAQVAIRVSLTPWSYAAYRG